MVTPLHHPPKAAPGAPKSWKFCWCESACQWTGQFSDAITTPQSPFPHPFAEWIGLMEDTWTLCMWSKTTNCAIWRWYGQQNVNYMLSLNDPKETVFSLDIYSWFVSPSMKSHGYPVVPKGDPLHGVNLGRNHGLSFSKFIPSGTGIVSFCQLYLCIGTASIVQDMFDPMDRQNVKLCNKNVRTWSPKDNFAERVDTIRWRKFCAASFSNSSVPFSCWHNISSIL